MSTTAPDDGRQEHAAPDAATVEDLAAHLTALADAELAAFLGARPDLLSPPAPSLSALAARAGGRASVEVAVAGLSGPGLAVAQAVVACGSHDPEVVTAALREAAAAAGQDGTSRDEVRAVVDAQLAGLRAAALVIEAGPVTGLVEVVDAGAVVPLPAAPGAQALVRVAPEAVADEASRQAEEAVRLVGALLTEWEREPAAVLRSGGVGVRALTRTAHALQVQPGEAAMIIEVAASAGLLGLDEAGAAWTVSAGAAQWRGEEVESRWSALVVAWAASVRTPWLVGTRNDDGSLRSVLADDVEAGWARSLRGRVMALSAGLPEGASVTAQWLGQALAFHRPRRTVPPGAVSAVVGEAAWLGLSGAGALSRAGRVLAAGLARGVLDVVGEPTVPEAGALNALLTELEAALAADLPDPVDVLLVQSDLTAIVPGRPDPALAQLLETASVVESRGAAMTVRFTPESVRALLDTGRSGEELLADLGRFSPTPLPATLVTLVHDAVRRHGGVRVREVGCVLRVEDPAVAAGLLADAVAGELGLVELAPGVVAASAPAGQVLRVLRAHGGAPVLEDADGRLLLGPGAGRRARPAVVEAVRPGAAGQPRMRRRRVGGREVAALIARMRRGEEARLRSGQGGASDPVHVMALLRQARATRTPVLLRVAGADGTVEERRVRVLTIESGRVRVADLRRETELTVAVHRIASATAVD